VKIVNRLLSLVFFVLLLALSACSDQHINTLSVSQSSNTPNAAPSVETQKPSSLPTASPTPLEEVELGSGLRIVPKNVNLENDRWRYKVDVEYPQIEGAKNAAILSLNRAMKNEVTKEYQWLLEPPTKEDIRHYEKWPEVFNSVDIDYDIVLAENDLLSIYLSIYSYGIGAAHSVHRSFTINYDFKSRRRLRLNDIFKPEAKYLRFFSLRCIDELTKKTPDQNPDTLFSDALIPKAKNFESWNITKQGLRFNFDACKVEACAGGDLSVDIPFSAMKDLLKLNSPLKPLLAKILSGAR
jgi:hypothetical protein